MRIVICLALCACGSSASLSPDGGPPHPALDAATPGADGAALAPDASNPADAAWTPDAGAAGLGDAGPGDTGPLGCQLEKPESAIAKTGFQQEFELADLTVRDGLLGFSYSWNQGDRKLHIADAVSLQPVWDGVIGAISGDSIPRAMDLAGGVFFIAGNYDASGQTDYTRLAFMDAAGVAGASGQSYDFVAVAAAREKAGGRVLALGKLVGSDQPVYVNRYDLTGVRTVSFEIGRDARVRNDWDLDFSFEADSGVACGVSVDATGAEALALYDLTGTSFVEHVTSEALATASSSATATFGCRIARGAEFVAVALAEGDGSARLVWLDATGKTLAGPVPFSTSKNALNYDVAVSGDTTALAQLDDSTGVARVQVRLYPNPAQTPIELLAESDLNLGSFDITGRRVRLAAIPGGFAVAFDAGIKLGQTDLYVRRILCE
jgi:hypothetical protein